MNRPLPLLASLGELLLLAGAIAWMPQHTWGQRLFTIGALLFATGRLLGSQGDYAQSTNPDNAIPLRRLHRQRLIGTVMLLLAAASMCRAGTVIQGHYLPPATWLIPFIPFVVIELCTAFRLPRLMDKNCTTDPGTDS